MLIIDTPLTLLMSAWLRSSMVSADMTEALDSDVAPAADREPPAPAATAALISADRQTSETESPTAFANASFGLPLPSVSELTDDMVLRESASTVLGRRVSSTGRFMLANICRLDSTLLFRRIRRRPVGSGLRGS